MMSHGWQVVFLTVTAIALSGCGAKDKKKDEGGPPHWDSFPVVIYTDPSVVPNDQALDDFHKAMEYWEAKVGKKLFDYQGNRSIQNYTGGDSVNENAIYRQTPWTYASNIAAQTIVLSQKSAIKGAVIMVNPSTQFCGGDCVGQGSRTSLRKVYAHELGHFIGLGHSNDSGNIMYPDALPGGEISGLSVNVEELRPLVQ